MFLTMPGAGEVDFFDLFYGTEIRRRHTDKFLAGFDRLAESATRLRYRQYYFGYIDHFGERLSWNVKMRELHPDTQVRANQSVLIRLSIWIE